MTHYLHSQNNNWYIKIIKIIWYCLIILVRLELNSLIGHSQQKQIDNIVFN